jgi:hypothetical protein
MQDPAGLDVIAKAPVLVVPAIRDTSETGRILEVSRVAVAPTPFDATLGWIETTDGQLYRLPDGLLQWACGIVTIVLGLGGNEAVQMFPSKVEFGILDGRAYAEIL